MKVCAGIVLYDPDIERLALCIKAIRHQVDLLIIVDNASGNVTDVSSKFNDEKYIWIKNNSNLGIAAALNQIINYAEKNNYEWVLTLDQDSICEDGLVQKLTAAVKDDKIAMVAPQIIDRGISEAELKDTKPLPETESTKMCITSGCLTNVKAVLETGGFNEWLFIYEVDREICIRLLRMGYKLVRVNTTKLFHEHGTKTVNRKFIWKKVTYRNYSPTAVYYQTRNLVFMLRKYGKERSSCPVLRWIRLYLAFSVKFICEPERAKRFKAFTTGIKDGISVDIKVVTPPSPDQRPLTNKSGHTPVP